MFKTLTVIFFPLCLYAMDPESEPRSLQDWELIHSSFIGQETSSSLSISGVEKENYDESLKKIKEIPTGKAFTPAQMRDYLKQIFALDTWEKSPQFFSSGSLDLEGLSHRYYFRRSPDKTITVVTSPAHDLDLSTCDTVWQARSGNLSLGKVIKNLLHDFPEEEVVVYIPQIQANKYWSLLRNHWVLSSLKIVQGRITRWEIYDPKGYVSVLYPAAYHTAQSCLKAKVEPPIKINYCGHQRVANNTDCGRFVVIYLYALFVGKDPLTAIQL